MLKVVDAPREIVASAEEMKELAYRPAALQAAHEGLQQDGFVVLKSVVEVEHVDALN